MPNHWSNGGDLIIEEKTMFRQVGWRSQSGQFYDLSSPTFAGQPLPEGSYAPIYEQIATWVEGEGWKD